MSAATFLLLTASGGRTKQKEVCDKETMPGFNHETATPQQMKAYSVCVENFYLPRPDPEPINPWVVVMVFAIAFVFLIAITVMDIRKGG